MSGGGGGGAGQPGGRNDLYNIGSYGGNGIESSITGVATYYAGGGGGGGDGGAGQQVPGYGGAGGGGNAGYIGGIHGAVNTGGGGGGQGGFGVKAGGNGGSGVVILRYPNVWTLTVGAGLTATTADVGSDRVTTFTAGTGTITFS
jgi:hypothetical protein